MTHVVDETTAEGEGFNFNQWLVDNDLLTLKDLFIKHEATTATTLQISSPEMQRLMVDPDFLSQPQMVPKLVMATHHLDVAEKIITVVLSEKEQAVIDKIKRESKVLDQIDEDVDNWQFELEAHRNFKRKRIVLVTSQINGIFDELFAALTERKQSLLGQIKEIEQSDDDKNNSDDNDISLWKEKIDDLRTFLKEKQREYDGLISVAADNVDRQNEILRIGKDVDAKLSATKKDMRKSAVRIERNRRTDFVMDFVTIKETYDRIIADIAKLGQISDLNRSEQNEERVNDDCDKKEEVDAAVGTGKSKAIPIIPLGFCKIVDLSVCQHDDDGGLGSSGWQDCASDTNIVFMQEPNQGKVWVICEGQFKRRCHHFPPPPSISKVQLQHGNIVRWCAFDMNEDNKAGRVTFLCKFADRMTAKEFFNLLTKATVINKVEMDKEMREEKAKSGL